MNRDGRRVLFVLKVLGFGTGTKILPVLGGGARTLRTAAPQEDKENGEDAPQGDHGRQFQLSGFFGHLEGGTRPQAVLSMRGVRL